MKNLMWIALLILVCMFSCHKDMATPPVEKKYQTGKNYYTTIVDGDTREYYVHVPARYDGNTPTPVVFMLHGTSGDGEKFYNISGWKEVGEVENILTVYPSSWRYNIIDEGVNKNTTKWHVFPGSFEYAAGETPRDDVKFLYQILSELKKTFQVDANRIYLAGFSNGGQMAFRCAVEMSDVFAAIVEASGTTSRDTTAIPKRNLPITFQLGNSDDMWLNSATETVPMSRFEAGLSSNAEHNIIVHTHTTTFDFDTHFTLSGDTNSVLIATYPGIPNVDNRQFNFVFIKDLDHNYPNGINHWFKGAVQHWAWFRQYSLP